MIYEKSLKDTTWTQREIGEWATTTFGLETKLKHNSVSLIIQQAPEIYQAMEEGYTKDRKSMKNGHFPLIDEALDRFIMDMAVKNEYINRAALKEFAKLRAKDLYPNTTLEELPKYSEDWLTRTMDRRGVKSRVI